MSYQSLADGYDEGEGSPDEATGNWRSEMTASSYSTMALREETEKSGLVGVRGKATSISTHTKKSQRKHEEQKQIISLTSHQRQARAQAWNTLHGYETTTGCPCVDHTPHVCIPKGRGGFGYNCNLWAMFCCYFCSPYLAEDADDQ
mmetsp:Transcript_37759/g.94938  ORF Transcript_37759/g.94938 Transcript_37759/m.94938 type:complete len:146 (-) Transcript_37759:89-526(-)